MIAAILLVALAGPMQGSPDTVAWLLERRCATCHVPESGKVRASRRWSSARDLAATARNPDLVAVGDLENSTLYLVLEGGEMPPADSGVPALTGEEIELVAAWIRAGAVAPAPDSPSEDGALPPTSAEGSSGKQQVAPRASASGWLHAPFARWAGRFHPMLVHFPVALLTSALIAEVLAFATRKQLLRTAASFCLALGALSAVPAVALGWLLAANSSHSSGDVDLHRWMGVSTAVASMIVFPIGRKWPAIRLPLLLLLAAMVGITGHLGAGLSFGHDWLSWPG